MKVYEDNHCESTRNTRKSKRIANQRLKDITNEDRESHQINTQKPKKRNRMKKTKKKPMSEEMKALKLKYQELAKEPLLIIKSRTKQNKITNAATSIAIKNISKNANDELLEDLGIEESFTRLNISEINENESIIDNHTDDILTDIEPVHEPLHLEPEPDIDFSSLKRCESISESEELLFDEISEEECDIQTNSLSSFHENNSLELQTPNTTNNIQIDTTDNTALRLMNLIQDDENNTLELQTPNTTSDIDIDTTDNTALRLVNLIQDDMEDNTLDFSSLDNTTNEIIEDNTIARLAQLIADDTTDTLEIGSSEITRLAELLPEETEDNTTDTLFNFTHTIEIVEGEQTRMLNQVLAQYDLINKQNNQEDSDEESEELIFSSSEEDIETSTIHGDFTRTLKNLLQTMD